MGRRRRECAEKSGRTGSGFCECGEGGKGEGRGDRRSAGHLDSRVAHRTVGGLRETVAGTGGVSGGALYRVPTLLLCTGCMRGKSTHGGDRHHRLRREILGRYSLHHAARSEDDLEAEGSEEERAHESFSIGYRREDFKVARHRRRSRILLLRPCCRNRKASLAAPPLTGAMRGLPSDFRGREARR